MAIHPLKQAVSQGHLRALDRYLAEQLIELKPESGRNTALAIALTSRAAGDGHVCLELAEWAGQAIFTDSESQRPLITLPELQAWREELCQSGLVAQADSESETAPLIIDAKDRLYLARYYHYEGDIESAVRQRMHSLPLSDVDSMKQNIDLLFPTIDTQPDQQKLAAALALLQPLTVISGGPGTGKTTTVTRILTLVLKQKSDARVALVAPTGKAAARLTESIRQAKQKLNGVDRELIQMIPEKATTVHRLLRPIRNSSQFVHNSDNPLHLDLLVVDEASMLDVPLMAKLMKALPMHCRIILLGDRDQLASVEAGSVFSDLCNRGNPIHYSDELLEILNSMQVMPQNMDSTQHRGMANHVAVLTHSHRFGTNSGIGQLARAINRGDSQDALELCKQGPDTQLLELEPGQVADRIVRQAIKGFNQYLGTDDTLQALEDFASFRILCALREGEYGVREINRTIEMGLTQAGLIDSSEVYYHGRPVMIMENDYNLELYNGDVGICLRDPQADNRVRVHFQDTEGGLRAVLPSLLPAHETTYAMTVHKSQGSEFEHCLLVLPQRDAAVLTRELIYTGVTRAKSRIEIWTGDTETFCNAIERKVERHSGLFTRLWS
ncbi:MAG: exodeoxyribonuclease V subunit alpha [Gammaproteobacteria bacterium]|nr:exodeoxyribonuclease V subunit alpha [Gammaproteobacteria bacterium]